MQAGLPWIGNKNNARGDRAARYVPARGLLAALLAMALAAALAAAAARNAPEAGAIQPSAPLVAPSPAPSADPVPRAAAGAAAADIEAVTAVVSRRYRISQDATRELVGAAYGEGRRIGLDPLLILAVMAVESHFNPIAQSVDGAVGLMQVIPHYHTDQLQTGHGESVLDPRTNIGLGARVLKEYIRRAGTEVAGLQRYNGAATDPSNGYANKVLGERQRLQEAVRRAQERGRA